VHLVAFPALAPVPLEGALVAGADVGAAAGDDGSEEVALGLDGGTELDELCCGWELDELVPLCPLVPGEPPHPASATAAMAAVAAIPVRVFMILRRRTRPGGWKNAKGRPVGTGRPSMFGQVRR
jgi:hypothetical protein